MFAIRKIISVVNNLKLILNFTILNNCLLEPIEGCLCVEDLMSRSDGDESAALIDVEKDLLVLPYSSGTTGIGHLT